MKNINNIRKLFKQFLAWRLLDKMYTISEVGKRDGGRYFQIEAPDYVLEVRSNGFLQPTATLACFGIVGSWTLEGSRFEAEKLLAAGISIRILNMALTTFQATTPTPWREERIANLGYQAAVWEQPGSGLVGHANVNVQWPTVSVDFEWRLAGFRVTRTLEFRATALELPGGNQFNNLRDLDKLWHDSVLSVVTSLETAANSVRQVLGGATLAADDSPRLL